MALDPPGWRLRWRVPSAVAVVTVLAFLPTLQNGFVGLDDVENLVDNPAYRGLGWGHLRWMFTTTLTGHWIPLTWISFGVDYHFWGMNPSGYHLTSVLLHAGGAATFALVAHALLGAALPHAGPAARLVGAAAAALIFAVHPLRVESVAWATERRDVLSGLWLLLAVLAYLRAARVSIRRGWWLSLSACCYLLAVLSKAVVMTLPAVLVLLDVYPLRRLPGRPRRWLAREFRARWAEKVPFVALAALAAGMAVYAQAGLADSLEERPPAARVAVAGYGLAFYVWKTLVPTGLSPLYELPEVVDPLDPALVAGGLVAVATTAGLIALRRKWPAGLAAWLAYAVLLSPVIGLTQSGYQLVALRYSYLSGLPWALLAGAGIAMAWEAALRKQGGRALGGVVGLACAAGVLGLVTITRREAAVWRDTESLWSRAVDVDPTSYLAHRNLSVALVYAGRAAEAEPHARRAAAAEQINLGRAALLAGDVEAAVRHFERALSIDPQFPGAPAKLARARAARAP